MTDLVRPRVKYVIGPDGSPLTIADLPPSNTRRWVIRRKAEVVAAVRGGLLSLDEACEQRVTFVSGWEQTGDPSTYAWDNHAYVGGDDPTVLDRCNGRVGPDGSYRYHATSTFPYILGCYHGEAVAGMP